MPRVSVTNPAGYDDKLRLTHQVERDGLTSAILSGELR